MRDRRVLLVVALVALAPVVGSVVVSAQAEADSYAVAQGTTCTVVEPVTDPSQDVSAFYDYRNPDPNITGNPPSGTYSSFGTRAYQESGASTLLFYEGSEGASLVLVHGELGSEAGGSTLTMSFAGLPEGDWVVEDDEYPGRDDDWVLSEDGGTVDWKWATNRTDGGAYRGIGDLDDPITITPAFNEEAAHWGEWNYSGSDEYRVTEWRVVGADGDVTTLDRDRRAFVHAGECSETPPEAALSGPSDADTTETVTLDASESTDDDAIGGYEWDLDGDGETETVTTEPTLEHSFSLPGDRTVTVTAFDRDGNGDTAELTVNVTVPSTPPSAVLDVPETATVNQSITLDASGSSDEGSITEYRWDFDGDGETDRTTSDPVVDHTYSEAGEVQPAVTVVDDENETTTATATVTVREPNSPPTATLDAPETVDEDEPVTLDAGGSSDDRGIDRFEWDPDGDGAFETETTVPTLEHTYEEPGNVTPQVLVVDTDGEGDVANTTVEVLPVNDPPAAALDAPDQATVDVPVTFDAGGSTDEEEAIAEYRWDFDGDGTVEANTTDPVTQHTYENLSSSVTATVTVVDSGGLNDTATASFEVLPPDEPPNASLDAPENATAGEPTTFDASNSSDDRGIEAFRWDFDGDGAVDEETSDSVVDHVYETGGTVEVTVTVVDSGGQTANASATTTVVVPPSPPTAALDAPAEAAVNRSVTLDASGSSDEGTITEYRWDVNGDGEVDRTTTAPTLDHTYTDVGAVEPTVTVVDDDNGTATAETAIEVVDPNYPPNASLAAPGQARVNESVTLDASGSTDEDGIAAYRWEFDGDGEIDAETAEPTVERAFTEAGRVTVEVTVVGTDGQTATATATIAVGDPDAAAASMTLGSDEPTAGESVTFDASGVTAASPITNYEWAFGDGSSGAGRTVEHTYDGAGEYEVTLTITTEGGVTASTTRTVTVGGSSGSGGGGNTGGGNSGGGGQSGGGSTGGGDSGGGGQSGGPSGGEGSGGQSGGGGQTGGGQSGAEQSEQETETPAPEPDIGQATVTLGSTELLVGQALVIEAEVANRGTAPGTKSLEFEIEGETVEVRTIPLRPGENRTVAFTYRFETPGEKRVEVDNGETRTVLVQPREPNISVATLSVDRQAVDTGQRFTLTANVTNSGHAAGERSVSLELFGETVATRTVSLDAGESTTVSFTRSVMSPGSYEAVVGNRTVSITVAAAATPTDAPSTTTEVPGFGGVTALLALLAAAAAARRRR